jgi:SOS-response transcriptional repressor LexA
VTYQHKHAAVLSHKRKAIYDFIREFIRVNKFSPTLQEIANAAELNSLDSVHKQVTALEQMGLITRTRGAVRSIQLAGACPTCGRSMPKKKAKGAAA